MNRYRVWEANRKVYLFPENWLEPELRDDKSPFFKEIESELRQSDITEDSATTALLNYLSKLEEVAKLEPCGIYHIPADPNRRTGESITSLPAPPGPTGSTTIADTSMATGRRGSRSSSTSATIR